MSVGNMFNQIFTSIKTAFSNHKLAIGICAVVFIVIGIVYYYKIVYPKYINKDYVDNREFIPKDGGSGEATLYFFSTDWCPLSKKAEPEWKAFKEDTGGSYDGVKLTFVEVDCDKNPELADKFNINGYPTIKLVYNDKIYEYDAKPDRNILAKFLTDIFSNP
jgi:thiol-disulfide isomerase/thioredoxin